VRAFSPFLVFLVLPSVQVGLIGDSQVGKTSLMVKYVENKFDEDYIQTLGVNFMEKTISLRNLNITFSIWDLGGQQEFLHMLPLVCNESRALLFVFDLCRKSSLTSIKQWYKQARAVNKTAIPFLIGTKYDLFAGIDEADKEEITKQARKFAQAMRAPLIFCSSSHSINVKKIFKIIVSKVFKLKCSVAEMHNVGEPIIEYAAVGHRKNKSSGGAKNTLKRLEHASASETTPEEGSEASAQAAKAK
jgi:GTP-binding protein of the ras superfamily involved in termination of M-phase